MVVLVSELKTFWRRENILTQTGRCKSANGGIWQTWQVPSIDSALSGLTGQDHTPTPVTYCTLRCCLARGHITDCTSSGGEQISLNQFALVLHLLNCIQNVVILQF